MNMHNYEPKYSEREVSHQFHSFHLWWGFHDDKLATDYLTLCHGVLQGVVFAVAFPYNPDMWHNYCVTSSTVLIGNRVVLSAVLCLEWYSP
jgi:hypothetical protein